MDMQDRVFYAAARAQLMAAKAEWARNKRADSAPSSSVTWLNKTVHSTLAAIDRRHEMDRARCAVQMIYQKESFEESKHPRAPAGRPDGGQFIETQGDADATPADISEKSKQRLGHLQRAQFESLNQFTTTELFAKLHSEKILAAETRNPEARAQAKASVKQIQQVLFARNFSDDNAPLAVKQRIWKAHQRYTDLLSKLQDTEDALAKFNEVVFWKSRLRTLAEQRRELIKAEMQRLANVTGARLPTENPIRAWSFEQKFLRTAEIALESGELAPEVAAQLRAAIAPANLARTAAMMATLAVAHSYPVAGLAADALLLGYVGTDAALVAYRLYLEVDSIQSEADLHDAARILNQELAAQTAGKLIQLLTWGAGKGTAAFNKHYKITLDHAKVKRLSNGSMLLSPNPAHLIPLKIVGKKSTTSKGVGAKPASRPKSIFPDWLKELFKAGQDFDRKNRHRYPHNEVEVTVNGGKFRVDSLHPAKGEIVSRRFTQLGRVKVSTAIGYFSEFIRKYSPGTTITNSPFNHAHLRGKKLKGKMIFEVPVQKKAIPQAVKDAATERTISIRDIKGKVYNP